MGEWDWEVYIKTYGLLFLFSVINSSPMILGNSRFIFHFYSSRENGFVLPSFN